MSRVYLDSMVWIYALESDPQFGRQAQRTLEAIDEGHHLLLSSHFLLAEVLVAPVKKKDIFLAASYRRALLARSGEVVPFTERVATRFAEIRAQDRVSSPDAIHLALAASAGAELFVTGDTRLQRLSMSGIGQIVGVSHALE